MARKIVESQIKTKKDNIPSVEELEILFNDSLEKDVKEKYMKLSIDRLIPLLRNNLISVRSSLTDHKLREAQFTAARISRVLSEVYTHTEGENKNQCFSMLKDAIEIMEKIKQISLEYYSSRGSVEDISENFDENSSSIKGSISSKEFYEMVKKKVKVLVIDYREHKEEHLLFQNYDSLAIIELCPMILSKYLSYTELINKLSGNGRSVLEKSNYSHIILMGNGNEGDQDTREEILIRALTELKNVHSNSFSPDVLPLKGGFDDFKIHYPNNVKKNDNTSSLKFSDHQSFLALLQNHRDKSSRIEEYPTFNKNPEKLNNYSEEIKENISKPVMIDVDKKITEPVKLINSYTKLNHVGEPKIVLPSNGKPPEISKKRINAICNNLDKLNDVKIVPPKPTIPDKATKPQIISQQPEVPARGLKENVLKKRKIFEDRIHEIYHHTLKDLEMRSRKGSVKLGTTGLTNLGNTCFMNSVLQALFHIPEIRILFKYGNVKQIINGTNKFGTQGIITAVFSALIDSYWNGEYKAMVPERFLVSFADQVNRRLADRCQQDAQEFQIYLLDALHEDTNAVVSRKSFEQNYNGQNLIEDFNDYKRKVEQFSCSKVNSLFNLRIVSTVECTACCHQSVTFEDSAQISVELPTSINGTYLSDCLTNHFSLECLDDGWKCPKCNLIRKATKTQRIWELPDILVIHKKRFAYVDGKCDKNNIYVDFQLNAFDMSPYIHEKNIANIEMLYDLYAIVNHRGSLNSGHYTSFVKLENEWFLCDDDIVSPVYSEDELKSDKAFMLYYRLKK
uniref:Ubiquitin carboxyl-terminal hydrolase n=1 Tax=Parastrongyloides trichosuri TaxID=131310 RepID=A0A0N5A1M1_PARTI